MLVDAGIGLLAQVVDDASAEVARRALEPRLTRRVRNGRFGESGVAAGLQVRRGGAARSQRAEHAAGLVGGAERRADVHQCLMPVGRHDGAARPRQQRFGERVNGVTRRRIGTMGDPAEDTIDVRVQYHGGLTERKRGNSRGRVRPDAGQFPELVGGAREFAVVAFHDLPCEPVQTDGATVVAHAGPDADDVGRLGVGKRLESGEGVEEGVVLRDDPFHLRLLEHDFRYEDGVRVRDAAPGQDAGVARVPRGDGIVDGASVDHRATRP